MPAFKTLRAAESAQLLQVIGWLAALLVLALIAIGVLVWQWIDQRVDHAAALAKAQTAHSEQLRVCGEVNEGANNAVETLTARLTECRGESQDIAKRLSRAIAQRDAAQRRIERESRADIDQLQRLLETHDACRDRPVCRPLSDELRRRWAESPAD